MSQQPFCVISIWNSSAWNCWEISKKKITPAAFNLALGAIEHKSLQCRNGNSIYQFYTDYKMPAWWSKADAQWQLDDIELLPNYKTLWICPTSSLACKCDIRSLEGKEIEPRPFSILKHQAPLVDSNRLIEPKRCFADYPMRSQSFIRGVSSRTWNNPWRWRFKKKINHETDAPTCLRSHKKMPF